MRRTTPRQPMTQLDLRPVMRPGLRLGMLAATGVGALSLLPTAHAALPEAQGLSAPSAHDAQSDPMAPLLHLLGVVPPAADAVESTAPAPVRTARAALPEPTLARAERPARSEPAATLQPATARAAAPTLAVRPGERLSDWLLRQPDPEALANPALMWLVPQEEFPQRHLQNTLVVALESALASTPSPLQRARQQRLRDWLQALPVTGRVALGIVDARWLQANPRHDPVLARGQRLRAAPWPLQTVAVVRPDGRLCQVRHEPGHSVQTLLAACDPTLRADHAWVAQPDGRTRRIDLNDARASAYEAMPGAWIWAPPRAMIDLTRLSEGLIQLLATQGPSPQPAAPAASPGVTVQAVAKKAVAKAAVKPRRSAQRRSTAGTAPRPKPDPQAGASPIDRLHERQPERRPERAPQMPVAGPAILTDNRRSAPAPGAVHVPRIDPPRDVGAGASAPPEAVEADALPAPVAPAILTADAVTVSLPPAEWSAPDPADAAALAADAPSPAPTPDQLWSRRAVAVSDARSASATATTAPPPGAQAARALAQQATPSPAAPPSRLSQLARAVGWLPVSNPNLPPISPDAPAVPPDWAATAARIEARVGWTVTHIAPHRGVLHVWIADLPRTEHALRTELATALLHAAAPADLQYFVLHQGERGLPLHTQVLHRAQWVAQHTRALPPHEARQPARQDYAPVSQRAAPEFTPAWTASPSPASDTTGTVPTAAPDTPAEAPWTREPRRWRVGVAPSASALLGTPGQRALGQLGVQAAGEFRITPNTWLSGQLNLRLAGNYQKYTHVASDLPRVRSHQREYGSTRRVTLPSLQLTHVGQFASDHYYSVYGGLLEGMYAGVGAEWLYRPWRSPFAVGVDINRVRQRDFAQDLRLRDYQATTGHATLYWDLGGMGVRGLAGTTAKISAGQYLAGDRGMTLDISKRLDNGLTLGAYVTKTHASGTPFGDGGIDKGIYLSMPLDALLPGGQRSAVRVVASSRVRDSGARLERGYPLYELTAARRAPAEAERTPAQDVARAGDNLLRFDNPSSPKGR